MRFVVYKHSLILGDNNIVTKQLIALKHDDAHYNSLIFIDM